MKVIGNFILLIGVILLTVFAYQFYGHEQALNVSLVQAEERISQEEDMLVNHDSASQPFEVNYHEAFATLEIPKLDKTLPIVEGTDPEALEKGVGHLSDSAFPQQGEQIVLSGHRDTVFRGFKDIEEGDQFIISMPYGTYTYKIKKTEIVPEDDTSVIRDMGEEVLVVTTCYPFNYVGDAPYRYVTYAYPLD
ncbi:class D sortase [Halalkalibacterium ligniniphilum]|uniref:class D sortase n=1 Tax=Halalkalibacterium ligniniphilum TaxID=1134413 RepID=UPI00034CECC4|nr:class D sortase [Halalkalibacterium ligniniphilum]